jgi:transcriptional regulator with PAS, ATPase and Fis domain
MQAVVEAAGHSRKQKAGAYLSSYSVQRKLKTPKVTIEQVNNALAASNGEKKAAAAALGISRTGLYRILQCEKLSD